MPEKIPSFSVKYKYTILYNHYFYWNHTCGRYAGECPRNYDCPWAHWIEKIDYPKKFLKDYDANLNYFDQYRLICFERTKKLNQDYQEYKKLKQLD